MGRVTAGTNMERDTAESLPAARSDTGRNGPSEAKAKAGSICVKYASPASARGGRARRAGGLRTPSWQRGCSWLCTWRSVFRIQPKTVHLIPLLASGQELARPGARWPRWGPRSQTPHECWVTLRRTFPMGTVKPVLQGQEVLCQEFNF